MYIISELEVLFFYDVALYKLKGSVKEPNISIYFFFPPITQWFSISDVLLTGGSGVQILVF